jgi:thiamine-monophosphate kinase
MTHTPLGPGREFDRIRAIALGLGPTAAALGDDAAVLPLPSGDFLVLSVDSTVEDTHFRQQWLTAHEIGWRATAAALSDLAAEGATAIGVLAALTVSIRATDSDVTAIMRGVGDCVEKAGGKVLGGDLTSGSKLSLTITVIGRAARPVTRSGARSGDELWVSGSLGGARAALAAFSAGREPARAAREAFVRPPLRIETGIELARLGATAMLDVSDGLGGDARHLAAASGVGLDIDLALLPVGPGVREIAGDVPAAVFAARGGEDYELLAALPPGTDVAGAAARLGVPLTRIGSVVAGTGVRFHLAGSEVDLHGYDHFA